ncbi:MAG: hypothetical protein E6J78_19210 [Deltaproteobacteria bacterium]|nr:MAG: hypothetical protein E6J78_19210 [Deltaproteobacteria bacterium]
MLLLAGVAKACALLTAADIASVQGEKPVKVRESAPQSDASHCFIALPTAAKSVSVEVTRGPRVAQLADRLRQSAEVESEEAGEHEARAVERVPGMGDEAFWAEGVRQGALYVRRGETLLRIAVGGDESKEAKLNKLRLLVRKALSRLPK